MADATEVACAMLALPKTVLLEYDGEQLVVYGTEWLAICTNDDGTRWLAAATSQDELLSVAAGRPLRPVFEDKSASMIVEFDRASVLVGARFVPAAEVANDMPRHGAPLPTFARPTLLGLLGWKDVRRA
jgi:hypothetical protein